MSGYPLSKKPRNTGRCRQTLSPIVFIQENYYYYFQLAVSIITVRCQIRSQHTQSCLRKKTEKKTCGLQSAVFSLFTVSSANSSCRPSRCIVEMIQFKNIHRQTDIPSFSAFRFLGSACVPKLTQKTNSRLPFFFFFFFLHGP